MVVGSLDVYFHSHMAPKIFFHNILLVSHSKCHRYSCHAWFGDAITYSHLCFVSLWPGMDLPSCPCTCLEFRLHIALVVLCPADSLINTSTECLNLESALCSTDGQLLSITCRNVFANQRVWNCHCNICPIDHSVKLLSGKQYETKSFYFTASSSYDQ